MNILNLGLPLVSQALADSGHNVINAGISPNSHLQIDHPVYAKRLLAALGEFQPDFVLYIDDGNMPLLIDPENLPCAAACYSIDSYCNPWHAAYASGFDLLFVAQKDFVPLFEDSLPKAHWLPLFAQDNPASLAAAALFAKRDIPVAFVGTLGHKNNPDRKPFLLNFKQLQPLIMLQGNFRPVFDRAKIALNQTAFSELNFRCFEAMSCGAALLMENCANGLLDIFTPGENILPPYPRNNAALAASIAKEWLAKPEELAEIASAGKNYVLAEHSATARAKSILPMLQDAIKNCAGQRAALAEKRKPFVRAAFGMLASEITDPNLMAHRDFFLALAR